jgi:hypothetical protein
MATSSTKPAGDKGAVKPAGDKGAVKPAGAKGSISKSTTAEAGPTWTKSLAQSVAGAVMNRVVTGPALDWMASSLGLGFLTSGKDATAETLSEINEKLDTVVSDLSEVKRQLTSVDTKISNLKTTLEAGLESLHLSIKDTKLQALQLRIVENANEIEGCFTTYMSAIEKLSNSKDKVEGFKAFQDYHDFTVANGGDSIVHYQQTLCDMALQENPTGVPIEVLRDLLDKVVIPQFKLLLSAQLKGLLYLRAVLTAETDLLGVPIDNLFKIMKGMKDWFAKLTKTYGTDFNVSQTLFFHRLPSTKSDLEALGEQAAGARIHLRVFDKPWLQVLWTPGMRPPTDPRRYIGFKPDGEIALFDGPVEATKLVWYDVGDGKISITNEAKTFYLHGQEESTAHALAADKVAPGGFWARANLARGRRTGFELDWQEREEWQKNIRGALIAAAETQPKLTPYEYGMSLALKDDQGNALIQNGQVLDLTRDVWFEGLTHSGGLFRRFVPKNFRDTSFEDLMTGNMKGLLPLTDRKTLNVDDYLKAGTFQPTRDDIVKVSYAATNFLRYMRYEVIAR